MKSEFSCRMSYTIPRKTRAFKYNRVRRRAYRGILSAHYAGNRHGFFRVAYGKLLFFQGVFFSVERNDFFSVVGVSDDNFLSRQIIQIERVHRLPYFSENVVRNVYEVVYRSYSNRFEPVAYDFRRLFFHHVDNRFRHISRTKRIIPVFNVDIIVNRAFRLVITQIGHSERFVHHRSHFAGYTENAVAIGSVRSDGNVQHNLVVSYHVVDVFADAFLFFKNKYSVYARAGIIVFLKPEFSARTKHTVTRYSAQFAAFNAFSVGQHRSVERNGYFIALSYVLRARNDLQNLFTYVYEANIQVVAVFMFFNALDLSHHYVPDTVA